MGGENIAALGLGAGSMFSGLRGLSGVSNGRFNSKLELKTWAMDFAMYHGKEVSDVMDLFKEEYEALPLTPNESLSREFQKSLDLIKDMMQDITTMVAESKAQGKSDEDIKAQAAEVIHDKLS